MAESFLQNVTPISHAVELGQDTIAPVETRQITPERLADVVDASDTVGHIEDARHHSVASRLLGRVLPGAAIGGFGLGLKGGLWSSHPGQTTEDQRNNLKGWMGLGAGAGALTGLGIGTAELATEASRLKRAKGVLSRAPQSVKTRLKDPDISDPARSYQGARELPLRLTELGILAGGIGGSAYGAATSPWDTASGMTRVPLIGGEIPNDKAKAIGKWGLIGSAGVGAAGLLGGLLMRHYRRKQLLTAMQHKQAADIEVPSLRPDVTLAPHQRKALQKIMAVPDGTGLLAYHGLGSGKTRLAIAAGEALGGKTEVVTPASLRENFKKEINKTVSSPRGFDIKSYQEASNQGLDPANLTVFDEAHRMGREGTATSKLPEHAHGKKMLLTGTPIRNEPSELLPLMRAIALDRELPKSQEAFDQEFIDPEHKAAWYERLFGSGKVIPAKLKNADRLKSLLDGRVDYHASKGDFPTKHTQDIDVEMSGPQTDLYSGLSKKNPDLVAAMRDNLPPEKSQQSRLNAFLSAARQISNNPQGFDDTLKGDAVDNSPKLQRMIHEVVKRAKNPNFKALVYSNYLGSGVEPMAARLNQQGLASEVFSGKLNDEQRRQMIDRFNHNKLKALMISGAGSEGLDLKGTSLVQLMEPHWNQARSDQVVGRAVRNESHEELPEDMRNVLIQRFFSKPKPTFLQRHGIGHADQGPDRYLQEAAHKKQLLNQQFLKILQQEGRRAAPKVAAQEVQKTPWVTLTDGTPVFLVDGVQVRNQQSAEFIGGGHHLVYPWIPKGEIWIDTEVPEHDRAFIMFHEIYEINLMKQGWTYDRAHAAANKLEDKLRKRKQLNHG